MAFTQAELDNIANAALDFYIRGDALSNVLQSRPLYNGMRAKQKTFPGGKENISEPVKGAYTTTIEGYNTDDTVTYANPDNIKRAAYPWKEIHGGISVTLTELKIDGISVVDSTDSEDVTQHSGVELTRLTGLLRDKLDDLTEGFARGFNTMLWEDGTQDAKEVAGVTSIVLDDPGAAGLVGGLDPTVLTWWQNRAIIDHVGSPNNGGTTLQLVQREYRQLKRYGGKANLWLAGADWIDQMETELRANGMSSSEGFTSRGKTDAGMADLYFKGNQILYDPTLDDLSKSKYLYILDNTTLYLDTMEGEDMKTHNPARPADQYVMYRALTYTGGMVCKQRNAQGVYSLL